VVRATNIDQPMQMNKDYFTSLLLGGDLRKLRQSSIVVRAVTEQESFDELFGLVFHHERSLVMRAVDAVEKVTIKHPEFLKPHKVQLMSVLKSADHKELKWHVAQLIPRIELTESELTDVRHILNYWALNKNESKIVRVNALQGLFDLSQKHLEVKSDLAVAISSMEHEMIPSIQARVKKLKKLLSQ
jgi:hypothetical protein